MIIRKRSELSEISLMYTHCFSDCNPRCSTSWNVGRVISYLNVYALSMFSFLTMFIITGHSIYDWMNRSFKKCTRADMSLSISASMS